MIRELIKTKSLYTSRKLPLKKVAEKNPEKINPQMKNTFYVIVVMSLLYFSERTRNLVQQTLIERVV